MRVAPEIFRAYDIRGVVPDQLDAAGAEQVGRAFVAYVEPDQAVIVGRDVRLTGQQIQSALIAGLTKAGADVTDIGQVSTDEFYFACQRNGQPGILVTASHNPSEYNGFKMVRKMPNVVMAKEFRSHVLERDYEDAPVAGSVTTEDVSEAFVGRMLELTDVSALKPLKVVVDTSNGAMGAVWERLAPHLPITAIPLFWEPDGSFPNHGNDVSQAANQQKLRAAVLEHSANLGLIFDPDGDRCLAVDDRGKTVPGDFIMALLAVTQLEKQPGSTIVYDTRASNAVPDMVSAAGGTPLINKPGHAYFKPVMAEHDAVFGGEVSGHFFFKAFGFVDCGTLAGLTMLEYVSKLGAPLSSKLAELESTYFLSGEINSTVADSDAVLARIKSHYTDGELSELSGVAVRYPDWHFMVRPSDNEPLMRLIVEATSQRLMETKRDELLTLIRGEDVYNA